MGIFVAILAATATAALNVFLKKLAGLSPNFLTWVRVAASLPALAILVTIFGQWSIPRAPFWLLIILATVPLEIILAYVGTKSLHLSPMSVMAPLSSLTSIFLIPIGFILLGELPTRVGLVGVLAIFLGSFLLGWHRGERFSAGLANVLKEKGSTLAILGAFLASVAVSVAKITFHYAPPLLTAFYINTLLTLSLLPFLLVQKRTTLQLSARPLAGLTLAAGVSNAFHYFGLSLIPAVYFISIKRLSLVINVLAGRFVFQEERLMERLAGSALMVAGIILIAVG